MMSCNDWWSGNETIQFMEITTVSGHCIIHGRLCKCILSRSKVSRHRTFYPPKLVGVSLGESFQKGYLFSRFLDVFFFEIWSNSESFRSSKMKSFLLLEHLEGTIDTVNECHHPQTFIEETWWHGYVFIYVFRPRIMFHSGVFHLSKMCNSNVLLFAHSMRGIHPWIIENSCCPAIPPLKAHSRCLHRWCLASSTAQ